MTAFSNNISKSLFFSGYLIIVCFSLSCLLSHNAFAVYPERALRLVVPFAPGGNIDITARTVSPGLTEILGQSVMVDNRGGAGGRIGTEIVAKSLPDGYTLLLGSSGSLAVNPAFTNKLTYDSLRDFMPTSLITNVPLVLVVHPSLPVRNASDFIALVKAKPGQVMMASAGTGSNTHLTGELFQIISRVKLTHVPYKGGGPAIIDLMSGQTHCIFEQVSTSLAYVRTGKLRPLAVISAKRSHVMPNVPTMAESGVNDFEASTYTGIFLPSATPKDIVQKVYTALIKVLDLPTTRDSFDRLGAEVIKSTPEEVTRRLRDDLIKWRNVQKKTGITLD
jgi:tripartite-type tricarboxylate transporter receptor subunit TctC